MASKILIPLLLFTTIQNVTPARILGIVPTASYSHQMFFQQIWRELALRGHDMVVITTDPTGENLPNFKEISIKENYGPFRKLMDAYGSEHIISFLMSDKMVKLNMEVIEHQMMLPQVQEVINNKTEHFDLLMIEHFPGIYYGLKHKYKCPMIGISAIDGFPVSHGVMGNPVHGVLYPNSQLPFQDDLNFAQRLTTVIFGVFLKRMFGNIDVLIEDFARKVYKDDTMPTMEELFDQTDMLFVNANPLFTAVRPHTPSTINLAGGVHMKKPQPLPKDLEDYINSSPNGIIYFSLGTNVKTKDLSSKMLQTFMDALSQLPYKVLWKFDADTLPGKPENVKITKWAPQQDILRHPKVKLFITQGGIQSIEEALYSYMPLVVLPFFGDQEPNAVKVKAKGMGLTLDPYNLDTKEFKETILEVINNKVYKDNVKKLAERIQDEPMTPLERAIWWTEYVLRHKGAQHLKGPRIPCWQYYYLDVFAFLGGVIILLLGITFGVIKLLIKGIKKLCCCRKTKKIKKN
ncbi:UDP-glycosyltransferase UGT5-like [Atheta coriaria]|uniref:UDP-glycosyltransferase UGT5-like n=1 Tax=Dalotia coriaria TaxID=877792 RepID=UPI0031F457AF